MAIIVDKVELQLTPLRAADQQYDNWFVYLIEGIGGASGCSIMLDSGRFGGFCGGAVCTNSTDG